MLYDRDRDIPPVARALVRGARARWPRRADRPGVDAAVGPPATPSPDRAGDDRHARRDPHLARPPRPPPPSVAADVRPGRRRHRAGGRRGPAATMGLPR